MGGLYVLGLSIKGQEPPSSKDSGTIWPALASRKPPSVPQLGAAADPIMSVVASVQMIMMPASVKAEGYSHAPEFKSDKCQNSDAPHTSLARFYIIAARGKGTVRERIKHKPASADARWPTFRPWSREHNEQLPKLAGGLPKDPAHPPPGP